MSSPINNNDNVHTLVAMPAYNEEKYIAKTIVGAKKYADCILVVDDGSKDDTVEISKALGAIVVQHNVNRGYGGALQTIFATAKKMGAEELVILDSDGQHNPKYIPMLLNELCNGSDVVIGSRFINGDDQDIPRYRKYGMKILDKATILNSKCLSISDSQSGFRAYSKRAIETIKINGNGMSAGSEVLIHVGDNNLKISEVPIKVRYDIEETSTKHPISHGLSVLMNLIRLVSCRRPIFFFGIPGLLLTLIGIGLELYTFSQYYNINQFHYIFFIMGICSIILGLLLSTAGLILFAIIDVMKNHGLINTCNPVIKDESHMLNISDRINE